MPKERSAAMQRIRERISLLLRTRSLRRGDRALIAGILGVTVRTLYNIEHLAATRKMGRPAFAWQSRWRALARTRRVIRDMGWDTGWRTASRLLPAVPTMLVQESLRAWKLRHRTRLREHRRAGRKSLRVLASQTVMGQDAYQQGPFHAEAVKDFATLRFEAVAAGAPASAYDVICGLETLKLAGKLPLVWATDNGPAYRSHGVRQWLANNLVVEYPSRCHTPQDNAPMERGVRELKSACTIASAHSPLDATRMLAEKMGLLNSTLPRSSRGFMTSNELDSSMLPWYRFTGREDFFLAVASARRFAVRDGMTARRARQAEREAVVETLVCFGLAKLERGDGCFAPRNRK